MLLTLQQLCCGYGSMQVVNGVDLTIDPGTITAILGANGAGKTSLIMSLAGQVQINSGEIRYKDTLLNGLSPMERVRRGIALSPEGRRLFGNLTVRENLVVGGYTTPADHFAKNLERVIALFPRLGERLQQKAGSLSGGEQQMLSISRALMAEPELLMVDELSLGLMPKAIDICYEVLKELNDQGLTILLVEQSTSRALDAADSVLVLESGNPVWQGTAEEANDSTDMIDSILGLHEQDAA